MDDPTPHLERFTSYDQAVREFQWCIPQRINIASAICRRHRDSITRIALSDLRTGGVNTYTFGGLDYLSDKFATALSESNFERGDPVVVALRPSAASAVAQLGVIKAGGVVVPLSPTSTPAFVEYVLRESGEKVLILDESLIAVYPIAKTALHSTGTVFVVRDLRPTLGTPYKDFWSEVDRCSSEFTASETESNSPVFIFFIETGGKISGIVHSASSIISQLAAFEFFNEFDDNAVFWLGDDWSSPTAVLGTVYPGWWYGCSTVASSSPDGPSMNWINECAVTNVFLRSFSPFGESTEPTDDRLGFWAENEMTRAISATSLNDVLGTPETGWIIGNSRKWVESRETSSYRVVPGRLVEIIDESGNTLPHGIVGQIAIHISDPGLFIGSHGEAANVSHGDWLLIGLSGYKTEAGELCVVPQRP